METVIKKQKILKWVRYLGVVFGWVMYWVIYRSLGEMPAILMGTIAGIAFFFICDYERKSVLFDYIAENIKSEIAKIGERECHIEIKMLRIGLIIRVYLIKAGDQTAKYSKAIADVISKSWYRQNVWITQVVGIENESDIKETEAELNQEIIKQIEINRVVSGGSQKLFSKDRKEEATDDNNQTGEDEDISDKED